MYLLNPIYAKILLFQHVTNIRMIHGIFDILFFILSLQNPMCILHIQHFEL